MYAIMFCKYKNPFTSSIIFSNCSIYRDTIPMHCRLLLLLLLLSLKLVVRLSSSSVSTWRRIIICVRKGWWGRRCWVYINHPVYQFLTRTRAYFQLPLLPSLLAHFSNSCGCSNCIRVTIIVCLSEPSGGLSGQFTQWVSRHVETCCWGREGRCRGCWQMVIQIGWGQRKISRRIVSSLQVLRRMSRVSGVGWVLLLHIYITVIMRGQVMRRRGVNWGCECFRHSPVLMMTAIVISLRQATTNLSNSSH